MHSDRLQLYRAGHRFQTSA